METIVAVLDKIIDWAMSPTDRADLHTALDDLRAKPASERPAAAAAGRPPQEVPAYAAGRPPQEASAADPTVSPAGSGLSPIV